MYIYLYCIYEENEAERSQLVQVMHILIADESNFHNHLSVIHNL